MYAKPRSLGEEVWERELNEVEQGCSIAELFKIFSVPLASPRGGAQFAKLSECISWIPICAACKMDKQFNNSSLGFKTKKANYQIGCTNGFEAAA